MNRKVQPIENVALENIGGGKELLFKEMKINDHRILANYTWVCETAISKQSHAS